MVGDPVVFHHQGLQGQPPFPGQGSKGGMVASWGFPEQAENGECWDAYWKL